MNVFETKGFPHGECIPRDLRVDEADAEYPVRKLDALGAKCATLGNRIISVSAELPPVSEGALLFGANGGGRLIGRRSLWHTWRQKGTGEWQQAFQVRDFKNANVTHQAVAPKAPEAGA